MRFPTYISLLTLILSLNSCLGSSLEAYDNRILSQDPGTILVAQISFYGDPMVLSLQDGGFLIFWGETWAELSTQKDALFGKIYNSDGTNRTSTITFITTPGISNFLFALLENGNILIVYITSSGIYGLVFSPDGTKIKDSFGIGSFPSSPVCSRNLTPLKNNRFVLVSCNNMYLSDSTATSFQFKTDAAEASTSQITVSSAEYSTVPLASGGFIVLYTTVPQTSSYNNSLYGKIYDSNGNAIGQKFLVKEQVGSFFHAVVNMLDDENILVVWQSFASNMYGKVFLQDGSPYGSEFLISNSVAGYLFKILPLSGGGFVVFWFDGTGSQVFYGQQYNASYQATGSQLILTSALSELYVTASMATLQDNSYVAVRNVLSSDQQYWDLIAWNFTLSFLWSQTNNSRTSSNSSINTLEQNSSSNYTGLIIGVVIGCAFVVIFSYIGIRIIRKRKNAQIGHILEKKKVSLDHSSQEKLPDIKTHNENNQQINPEHIQTTLIIPEIREDLPVEFAPKLDARLAKPALNLLNQESQRRDLESHLNVGMNVDEVREDIPIDLAPKLDVQDVQNFLMDGRLAKPVLNLLNQEPQRRDPVEMNFGEVIPGQIEGFVPQDKSWRSISKPKKQEENIEDLDNVFNQKEEKRADEEEAKQRLCIVCENEPSVMVFLDCMHMCTCQGCSAKFISSTNKCPICRETIRDIRRVYAV